jgi:hypothetical protein
MSARVMVRVALGSLLLGTSALALLPGVAAAAGSGKVRVLSTIPFGKDAQVPEKVRDGCKLQTKVPQFLSQASSQVELVEGKLGTSGRTLELEITEVHAPGGGAFSGPKWMSVTGVLRDNGRRVAGFTAHRTTTGGVFAGYKGTCSIVGRCAKTLGSDIAGWLSDPKDGAKLGD